MNAAAHPPGPAAPPLAPGSTGRARVRLLVLVVLVLCWISPWPEMELQTAPGATPEFAAPTGAERTGAIGALMLLAIWGLAATALAARTQRGLRLGAALTDAAVAAATAALLFSEHPWIPGGDIREAWGAIFAPLALLALLEAATLGFQGRAHRVVAVIRAGAAVFAGGSLAVSLAWIPAIIACWLALSPLLFLKLRSARGGRRGLEGLLLLAAVTHGLSFRLQPLLSGGGVGTLTGSPLNLPFATWGVLAAILTVTAIDGVMRPGYDDASTPVRA